MALYFKGLFDRITGGEKSRILAYDDTTSIQVLKFRVFSEVGLYSEGSENMGKPFHGGIHFELPRDFTPETPPALLPAPDLLFYPLIQHRGAAAEPLVSVGDQVCMGQKIADCDAAVTACIHASVSGVVRAIEEHDHPDGGKCMTIVIENDHLDTPAESMKPSPKGLSEWTGEDIIAAARESGISGMGGAGFPLAAKLSGAVDQIDTVILNGCECEPLLQSDHATMRFSPKDVAAGGVLIARAVHAKNVVIAIESDKSDAAEALRGACADFEDVSVSVHILPARYPQGGERVLITAITGKEIPPGKLPASIGVLLCNVGSAAALYAFCAEGRPLISRNVTVAGSAVERPAVLNVRLGTPFETLLEHCGVQVPYGKLISGGPMMGKAQYTAKVPVIKTVSGILVYSKKDSAIASQGNCIHCGRCVRACPMQLAPLYLNFYSDRNQLEDLERLHLDGCIECGVCTWSCPAGIPLVQKFRLGKMELAKQRRAAKMRQEEGNTP